MRCRSPVMPRLTLLPTACELPGCATAFQKSTHSRADQHDRHPIQRDCGGSKSGILEPKQTSVFRRKQLAIESNKVAFPLSRQIKSDVSIVLMSLVLGFVIFSSANATGTDPVTGDASTTGLSAAITIGMRAS
jgi:preprotein translocase subunit SecE